VSSTTWRNMVIFMAGVALGVALGLTLLLPDPAFPADPAPPGAGPAVVLGAQR
jgi:hypothetical protein